jgi:LysM repeat protein
MGTTMSIKKHLGLVILLFSATMFMLGASTVTADTVKLRADHPDKYTVVKGDTLWDISAKFLESPWLWPEVWSYNPQIKNPHLIYPGDVVYLEYDAAGKPVLKVTRGAPSIKMTPQVQSGKGVNKLSPQVRTLRVDAPIATIPLNSIQQFLGQPRVLSKTELENSAYIVSSKDSRLISGAGDRIYARGIRPGEDPKSTYAILRIGKAYRNPGTSGSDILGYEAIHVADAKAVDFGDPSVLNITESSREALVGDRIIPKKASGLDQTFIPHPPSKQVEGQIISVIDGLTRIGQYQTIVINKGDQDGLETGHVLAVYQSGKTVRDANKGGEAVTLPDLRAGVALVYRTFDHVSYALVMEAYMDMKVFDMVRNP